MEPSDGFSREELDESVAAGKHSKRNYHPNDKWEALLFLAFFGGMVLGMIIMDMASG